MSRMIGYRSIVVPLADNAEADTALDVACRLAADRGARLTAVAVVVPAALLPVDALMPAEDAEARRLLDRAATAADRYGIDVSRRLVRARDAAPAIVAEAAACEAELIVIGAARRGLGALDRTTDAVLKGAACRVLLIAQPAEPAHARIAV